MNDDKHDPVAAAICVFISLGAAPGCALWEHYKRGTTYRIRGVAYNADTLEPMVVYQEAYTSAGSHTVGKRWVRPIREWIEEVENDDYQGPRFFLIGERPDDFSGKVWGHKWERK